jgi:hypothetical protein
MKKLLAASAIVMTVVVAAAIFVIPALAHGTVSQTSKHASVGNTGPNPFTAEHQHGTHSGDGDHAAFEFSCAGSGAVKGNRIINVTESIVNDVDSGEAGNYWAFDTVKRSITIWNVGPDQYCAILNYYDASFKAIAGQTSPGKGGVLSGEEYGSFAGSARFTITGQLYVSDPTAWPTSGKVNGGAAVDYQCDVSGNCPGYVSFLAKYFNTSSPSFSFDEPQWGWRYVGLDSGTKPPTSAGVWINAYTGNSGDILDSDD